MENGGAHAAGHSAAAAVEIYPLSRYYFGAKDAFPDKDETPLDTIQRLKSNFASHGLRTCVQGVLLVELLQHPHVLVLQVKNSFFKLPGGRLRPGEQDVDGLKRKLSRMFSLEDCAANDNWQVYGPIISGIPHLLSKFSFNIINDD